MNNHTITTKTTPSPSPGPGRTSGPSGASPTHTPTSSGGTSGTKRKRAAAVKFYAVKEGFRPGVYYNWNDCLAQVTGFKGAVFQSFPSLEEANTFLTGQKVPSRNGTASTNNDNCARFYAVQRGRVPGVYSNWAEAQEQIKGFTRPRYKKFDTRQEAEEFVKLGQENGIGKSSSIPGGLTTANPTDAGNGDAKIPATFAPLPPGAEDGFDPNVLLEPSTGKIVYKGPEQKLATKAKPTAPPGMLRIYTDGSSLGNGKKIAQAGVGVYFGPGDSSRNVSEPLKGHRQTNQRAELTAIIRALEIAPRHRPVTIVTDSRYAIDCVTNWFRKWIRNNWQTSDGKPVENKDLIQSILVKINERDSLKVTTTFEWVKGHSRDAGNEAADKLAVNGARRGFDEQISSTAVGLKTADDDDDIPDELADEFDDF